MGLINTTKNIMDFLKQLDKFKEREKKPHIEVDEWAIRQKIHVRTANSDKKAKKHLVVVKKCMYELYSAYVRRQPSLNFYITTEQNDYCYMFIVWNELTPMKQFTDIVYFTVDQVYSNNIAWILERGSIYELYDYDDEVRLSRDQIETGRTLKAGEILEMSDEDARQVLSLKDYKIYLDLKEREKNLK